MKTERQRSILLLTEWLDTEFIEGVARYAQHANWHLNIDYIGGRKLPKTWKGDGCISLTDSVEAYQFRQDLNVPIPRVLPDNASHGRLAADYFVDLGFKNFAFYAPAPYANAAEARFGAYRERLSEHGVPETQITQIATGPDGSVEWATQEIVLINALTALPRPAAVFCVDDRMALRIVEACIDGGLDIPNEVAVLGVGNMELASKCSAVPLSSIRINFERIGYEQAAQLDGMLNGEKVEELTIAPDGIQERRSTYTLAIEDPAGRKAIRFMLDHLDQPIRVRDICKAGALNPRQLSRILRTELNTSAGALLEGIRIKKACKLLTTTTYPVKRVAYETGLGTALRLQRIFRRRFQTTPTAWRKAQRKSEAECKRGA